MMGLLDTIAPTPRNRFLGLLADAAQGVSDFAARPFGYDNPPGAIVASLLGVPDIAKTLDRLSYGEPLTTGTGMTLRPREEAVNAAMAALPLGATLGKGAIDAGVYAAQKAAPAIERVVPRIMKRGGLPAEILRGMSQQTVSPLTVWHGSPHKFDKFDSSKIGTGEGAQAYGHGLYLAESPDVAKSYQTALAAERGFSFGGKSGLTRAEIEDMVNAKYGAGYLDGVIRPSGVAGSFIDDMVTGLNRAEGAYPRQYKPGSQRAKLYDELRGQITHADPGSLYKVDLPDEHIAKMLDWDKPLSQQHPDVQKALSGIETNFPEIPDFNLRKWMDADPLASTWHNVIQRDLGVDPAVITSTLKERGVPGIRYLDGGSRGTGAGTSNFVVFPGNEKILKILERNGKPVGLLGN